MAQNNQRKCIMNIRATTARYTETSAQGPRWKCQWHWMRANGGAPIQLRVAGWMQLKMNQQTHTHTGRPANRTQNMALCAANFPFDSLKWQLTFVCVCMWIVFPKPNFWRSQSFAYELGANLDERTRVGPCLGEIVVSHIVGSVHDNVCVCVWLCTSAMRLCENKRISSDSLINTNLKNILINTAETHTHTQQSRRKNVFAKTFRRVGENGIFGRI